MFLLGAGSLVTTPAVIDGVLTSCDKTQLTCSHDDVAGQVTRWEITRTDSSSVCFVIIDHNFPTPDAPYRCDEFGFEDVTALPGAVSNLNSTAIVNSLPFDLNGSQMECRAGAISTSPLVGNVTLCVIGEYTCC